MAGTPVTVVTGYCRTYTTALVPPVHWTTLAVRVVQVMSYHCWVTGL